MTSRQKTGVFGENAATEYLKKKYFNILERNYRSGRNEIDIIAENDEFLLFVEVKTRMSAGPESSAFGRPAAAVNYHKQQCTVACARDYLYKKPTDKQPRMDVIEVYVGQNNGQLNLLSICHMENAYGG